jgi:hypothetical protein
VAECIDRELGEDGAFFEKEDITPASASIGCMRLFIDLLIY